MYVGFPTTYQLFEAIETFGATTSMNDLSFSALSRIDTMRRSSMTDQRLRDVAFLAFEKNSLKSLKMDWRKTSKTPTFLIFDHLHQNELISIWISSLTYLIKILYYYKCFLELEIMIFLLRSQLPRKLAQLTKEFGPRYGRAMDFSLQKIQSHQELDVLLNKRKQLMVSQSPAKKRNHSNSANHSSESKCWKSGKSYLASLNWMNILRRKDVGLLWRKFGWKKA